MALCTFDSCLITEEVAFGCAGIKAALLTSNIGVSPFEMYTNFCITALLTRMESHIKIPLFKVYNKNKLLKYVVTMLLMR